MIGARGRVSSILAVCVALLVAIATAMTLVAAEQARPVITSPDTPISALPGQPGEAPVLADIQGLPADEARKRNAADPFFPGTVQPAPPFRLTTMGSDFDRARECLALAAMAEAGPSDDGQRAVMQVILNRVRHPAFAKTICGVVFEGADRSTGCQFTFTCDGSLTRQYSQIAWDRARARATAMLRGQVFAKVGNATHYHTDWVYPYWSPQLVKLTQVDTHLFFRWPGYWGTPAAMRIAYRGAEPDMAGLAGGGESPVPASLPSFAPLPPGTPKVAGGEVKVRDASGRGNFLLLSSSDPEQAVAGARKLCGTAPTCRVLGWLEATAIPARFPIPPASRAALAFSFSRDPSGAEIVLYDCRSFAGIAPDRCIPRMR
ncbi:spore germination cell wall hydrolase CwlJ-like protein [Novosphingobium kunmingense]|uniref:Spore germination cell wall hydrolase CwlJ-like protein n=1 Tax=Novosphingobium kunmingense TaxID=1211806 RepID=A0A2N0H6G1_9SPHN|nr:cell wall hydrolase [Novosphingobium kunmingense]PKB14541.1 spore germination cell wall hydrolase CwlJ-like protein [Novosphingobium kunmingense]